MKVSEAIDLLKGSKLKQLSVKDDPITVLGYLNMAILELHKRFKLWQAEATITFAADVYTYVLDGVDANVTIDLTDNMVLLIEKVKDNEDIRYTIDDIDEENTLYFNKWHTITFEPTIVAGETATVIYRAAPKFLTTQTQTIPLPPQFFEAMFLYVGYEAQGGVKSGERDENNAHYKRFQASCDQINFNGLIKQDSLISTKFFDRGFV